MVLLCAGFNDKCERTMIQLYHGDCLDKLQKTESNAIDLVLADPPYGMDFQSQRKKDKTQWRPKILNDKRPFVWFIYPVARVLKDGGDFICFCRFDSWFQFQNACELSGLSVKAEIVWDKLTHGTGDLNGCCGFRHEIAVFATKGRFEFHDKRPQSLFPEPRVAPQKLMHPNEKPVGVMEWLVEHYCPPGGTTLDPFMGSGTTGVACMRNDRNFIGIELDDKYFQIAKKRIENERGLFDMDKEIVTA